MEDTMPEGFVENFKSEIRRGVIVLAVLSQMQKARYGYSLVQRLNYLGIEVEEGTLYPILRRLEKQGLLTSQWETEESRPRKYYQISPQGRKNFEKMHKEWLEIVEMVQHTLQNNE